MLQKKRNALRAEAQLSNSSYIQACALDSAQQGVTESYCSSAALMRRVFGIEVLE